MTVIYIKPCFRLGVILKKWLQIYLNNVNIFNKIIIFYNKTVRLSRYQGITDMVWTYEMAAAVPSCEVTHCIPGEFGRKWMRNDLIHQFFITILRITVQN